MSPDDVVLRELIARCEAHHRDLPQFGSLAGARQYRLLHAMARRHLRSGAEVLDWGSGNGHFSYFLLRRGYRPTGFSIEGVSSADWLDEPYDRFVGGNVSDPVRLPFEDDSFDAVGSIGVLEHVRETGGSESASLREIVRVLRPGGVFLCYHFPNRWSWIDAMARRVPGRHRHEFRYTRADILALAHAAGLTVVELHRYGFLPRNSGARLPADLRRSKLVADVWDGLDAVLGTVFSPLCQNWGFVAIKHES